MPTPPKPFRVIELEGKSHRTKAELENRKKQEEALLSGEHMRELPEVRNDPNAHAVFLRIRKLLRSIDKHDDLYGAVINRYALLTAECMDFMAKRERFYQGIKKLEDEYAGGSLKASEYLKLLASMQSSVIGCDKQIQAKRKMMLDIEKENVMTIAAALRAIPKDIPDEEEENDPFKRLLEKKRNSM